MNDPAASSQRISADERWRFRRSPWSPAARIGGKNSAIRIVGGVSQRYGRARSTGRGWGFTVIAARFGVREESDHCGSGASVHRYAGAARTRQRRCNAGGLSKHRGLVADSPAPHRATAWARAAAVAVFEDITIAHVPGRHTNSSSPAIPHTLCRPRRRVVVTYGMRAPARRIGYRPVHMYTLTNDTKVIPPRARVY